jgi:hypothetical protein
MSNHVQSCANMHNHVQLYAIIRKHRQVCHNIPSHIIMSNHELSSAITSKSCAIIINHAQLHFYNHMLPYAIICKDVLWDTVILNLFLKWYASCSFGSEKNFQNVLEKAFFFILSGFFLNWGFMSKNLRNGPSESWKKICSLNRSYGTGYKKYRILSWFQNKMLPQKLKIKKPFFQGTNMAKS